MIQADEAITARAHTLARAFVVRAKAQGWRGKTRDDRALEWFLGAAVMLRASGQPDHADYIERLAAFLIATRGYRWVEEFARQDNAGGN